MRLIFLGPPGAGKGTLAGLVSKEYGIPQISTGDIFRDAIKRETELGKKVKEIVGRGDLVPDELTVSLVRERLAQPDAQKGYILDGFPRTIPQARALAPSGAFGETPERDTLLPVLSSIEAADGAVEVLRVPEPLNQAA